MSFQGYADRLAKGETVQFRPRGNSMLPIIKSGQLVTIAPSTDLYIGSIVFCKVKGNFYVHLVKAIKEDRYLISNNKGHENGWVGLKQIFGKVMKIED